MRKFTTISDHGTFLLGNKDFSFRISNYYGGNNNDVYVFSSEDEFEEYFKTNFGMSPYKSFNYVMRLSGKFNIYARDTSPMEEKEIACEFDGEYVLFAGENNSWNPTLSIVKVEQNAD